MVSVLVLVSVPAISNVSRLMVVAPLQVLMPSITSRPGASLVKPALPLMEATFFSVPDIIDTVCKGITAEPMAFPPRSSTPPSRMSRAEPLLA